MPKVSRVDGTKPARRLRTRRGGGDRGSRRCVCGPVQQSRERGVARREGGAIGVLGSGSGHVRERLLQFREQGRLGYADPVGEQTACRTSGVGSSGRRRPIDDPLRVNIHR